MVVMGENVDTSLDLCSSALHLVVLLQVRTLRNIQFKNPLNYCCVGRLEKQF